jgi:hypothetical protein
MSINILMYSFPMLDAAGVFVSSLFKIVQVFRVTSSLIKGSTENDSTDECLESYIDYW